MFSTTTMASSTRMPIEKISANSDTRSMLMPIANAANTVIRITTGMTMVTTIAGFRPSAYHTRMVTMPVATTNLNSSSLTFSCAVSP